MKIHTFDIFDTCLFRACSLPEYVFDILALKVLNKKVFDDEVYNFAQIRKSAETNARKKKATGDVNIDEIYELCDFTSYTSLSNEIIKYYEIEVERSVLYPNTIIQLQIENIHKRGENVIFISDMYLPSSFLKEVLSAFGLFVEGDELFVSCEEECRKCDGKLFRKILRDKNLKAKQIIHTGDNKLSDFISPLKIGIKAKYFKRKYTDYQKKLSNSSMSLDYDVLKISSSISNSISSNGNIFEKFTSDLIAPILVPFTLSVLEEAKKDGVNKIFFLARDGYLLYRIALQLKDYIGDIEVKYLYVSRRSLYFPNIPDFLPQNKERLIQYFKEYSLAQTVDILQIEDLDLMTLKDDENIENSSELIIKLLDNGKWKDVERRRQEQGIFVSQYFVQEGLANTDYKSAIVDLRGSLRTQQAMNIILAKNGYPVVKGYYFELQENRLLNKNNCDFNAYLLRERYVLNNKHKYLSKAYDILEQYFCCTTQNRTKNYVRTENGIMPIFENYEQDKFKDDKKDLVFSTNLKGCLKYADLFIKSGADKCSNNILLPTSISLLSDFMRQPSRKYLKALNGFVVSENALNQRYLVTYATLRNLINHRIQWIDGSFALTFGIFGLRLYRICFKILRILK